ncbi:MAG: hypothetical protein MZU95_00490 [Desulfomicrobium escambiense]|nr:hypothetical protein [Desulfomicrobium escambiense]
MCVCPARDIDRALEAAKRRTSSSPPSATWSAFPPRRASFERAKAEGCDIRVVYSPVDAVRIARLNPDKEVVFMAVGFETTAAPIAASLADDLPPNFSIVPSMRLVPPALRFLMARSAGAIDGFVLPGHVSAIIVAIGVRGFIEKEYGIPAVIAGFEAIDVLRAVREGLLAQIAGGARGTVENQRGTGGAGGRERAGAGVRHRAFLRGGRRSLARHRNDSAVRSRAAPGVRRARRRRPPRTSGSRKGWWTCPGRLPVPSGDSRRG